MASIRTPTIQTPAGRVVLNGKMDVALVTRVRTYAAERGEDRSFDIKAREPVLQKKGGRRYGRTMHSVLDCDYFVFSSSWLAFRDIEQSKDLKEAKKSWRAKEKRLAHLRTFAFGGVATGDIGTAWEDNHSEGMASFQVGGLITIVCNVVRAKPPQGAETLGTFAAGSVSPGEDLFWDVWSEGDGADSGGSRLELFQPAAHGAGPWKKRCIVMLTLDDLCEFYGIGQNSIADIAARADLQRARKVGRATAYGKTGGHIDILMGSFSA